MNEIIKLALEAKGFTAETANNLLDVAENTGNAVVAIEVILGIYKEPVIPTESSAGFNNRQCTFKSYDKYTNEVKYTYEYEETRSAYFSPNVNEDDVNMENFNDLKISYDTDPDKRHYLTIKTGKVLKSTKTCSLDKWMENSFVPNDELGLIRL